MAVPVLAPPRHLPPPGATLPRGRERLRTGTAVSMALHALVLLVVLWQTTDIFGGGGGTGTGTGPGNGSDVGPGTGGEGDYIQRADLRGSILPPQCMRGRYTVRFWVAADGHVSRVEVTPTLRDGGCRQEMQERMMGYRFRPALNLNGRPVPDIRDITVSH